MGSFSAASGQSSVVRPAVVPYPNYVPVVAGNPVLAGHPGIDPYATVNVQTANWWIGNGAILPMRASIRDRLWWRAEYLHWWTEGMDLPPLVTTSPPLTPQNQAAVLGEPGTAILFGNGEINGDSVSGFRTRSGFWLNPDGAFAIEGEYFQLAEQDDGYHANPVH